MSDKMTREQFETAFGALIEEHLIAPAGPENRGEAAAMLAEAVERELAKAPEELDAVKARLDAKRAERDGR